MKDPFDTEKQKNPFESNDDKNTVFKDTGLSLGLKSLNSRPQQTNQPNPFKNSGASPSGAFYFSGMDSNKATKGGYYGQFAGGMYPPMMSPYGATPGQKYPRKDMKDPGQSPRVDSMGGVFQTPTSKGVVNQRLGDMSGRKDETGSFGASPRDISTTKAVFDHQTKFGNLRDGGYDMMTPNRYMGKDFPTPANYFVSSPAYGQNGFQNVFVQNYGNTPTGGSFGASPAAWVFNMPSPHTGMANAMTPFNQGQDFTQKDGQQEHSPKFNSVSESSKQPGNMKQSGQDSSRALNQNLNNVFTKNNQMTPNYAPSPAHAFSFS